MTRSKRLLPLAIVASAVLLAAGCGGGGGGDKNESEASKTRSWASGLCGALVTWQDNLRAAGERARKGRVSKKTLDQVTSALVHANAQLRDDLRSLGKPPTPVAKKARSALERLAENLRKNADKIRAALHRVTGANNLLPALTAASGAFAAMQTDVSSTAKRLRSLPNEGGWRKALANAQSCRKLQSR